MTSPDPQSAIDPASHAAAVQATESALPFVEWLMQRFNRIAHDLRNGEDKEALGRIEGISKDLQDFFQYTFLISDMLSDDKALIGELKVYRERLSSILESINPALDNLDLVEVADIIEHEIIGALTDYGAIHDRITSSLEAA